MICSRQKNDYALIIAGGTVDVIEQMTGVDALKDNVVAAKERVCTVDVAGKAVDVIAETSEVYAIYDDVLAYEKRVDAVDVAGGAVHIVAEGVDTISDDVVAEEGINNALDKLIFAKSGGIIP